MTEQDAAHDHGGRDRCVAAHLHGAQTPDAEGEGDHYPWKVYVNQRTGERIVPASR